MLPAWQADVVSTTPPALSYGKCSAGSTVRGTEHGIYLDGNSFASSLTIPEALSGLPAENVVSCCHL